MQRSILEPLANATKLSGPKTNLPLEAIEHSLGRNRPKFAKGRSYVIKKTITGIGLLVLLLSGSFVLAQMGGGMMEGQNKSMHHEQMMEHGQMMSGMMGMSNQMSAMMSQMSGMMKEMPAGQMKMMSGVMNEMSHQMQDMSMAMASGKVSANKMKRMQDRMMEIQKEMSGMEMHK